MLLAKKKNRENKKKNNNASNMFQQIILMVTSVVHTYICICKYENKNLKICWDMLINVAYISLLANAHFKAKF